MAITAPELVHAYTPRGACAAIWPCRDPELLLAGPAGTGKSRACLEKLHLVMLANPGARGLIVRKTQASLGSTALDTWRKAVIPEALRTGEVRYHGGSGEHPASYRYRNGSVVIIGGMDRSSKIMSSEYDMIYVQEAIELTQDDWEALTTRLRNGRVSFQQLLADCNPDAPGHWLKLRCDAGTTTLLESRHEDNPTLFGEDGQVTESGRGYIEKLDRLTGVRFQRLRRGLWVGAEGLIYTEWDPVVHLVDSFPVPEEWPRWWSVDFGYVHPLVVQHWAEDHDGRLWLYREFYRTGRTVDQHAEEVLNVVAPVDASGERVWLEPVPRAVVTDHDAEDRATLERALGRSTTAANKKVSPGLQAVQRRLRDRRLFIMRDCRVFRDESLADGGRPTCTAEEFPGYVWADHATKEQPRKEDDDGLDALRYVVAQRDLGGRPNLRWF
jgi:phage terminase large subunit